MPHTTGPIPQPRILDYGPHATMIELDNHDHVDDLFSSVEQAISRGEIPGVRDIVPAARTVLVVGESESARAACLAHVATWQPGTTERSSGQTHEIHVVYDGPDLDEVCRATGLSRQQVVDLHSGTEYRVAFMGFAPGFGYLTGLPDTLQLPRRKDPRAKVPPRSLAIAGQYSAVYPRTSPGGWNLLGQTVESMWDPSAERPNLLAPGDTVRFVPVPPGFAPHRKEQDR